jgi:hypothetical protein
MQVQHGKFILNNSSSSGCKILRFSGDHNIKYFDGWKASGAYAIPW